MPLIQILNVHASEGCGHRPERENTWRDDLCDKVEAFVNDFFDIDGEYTEMFLPHDPSTPLNAPVTVIVDFLPEDPASVQDKIARRSEMIDALGHMLELEICQLRRRLGPGIVRRVRVRVIGREPFRNDGFYYISPKVDKQALLMGLLPLDATEFEKRIAGALERMRITSVHQLVRQTSVTLTDLNEEEVYYILDMLGLDDLRLGMNEESIDAWLNA